MHYKKMNARKGKVSNVASSTPNSPMSMQNPVVVDEVSDATTIAPASTVFLGNIGSYYTAFNSGLEHSNDFRYIVASTLIGGVGGYFIGPLIGFPIMGFLVSMFSISSFTFIVSCNIVDKLSNNFDSSNSQISYFGSISSIVDYGCGAILFGKGTCYGDTFDKSYEYFFSIQTVKNGLDHATEIKYQMITLATFTTLSYQSFNFNIGPYDPLKKLKFVVTLYIMNSVFSMIILEELATDNKILSGPKSIGKFIGAIPSIIDHQCDLILHENTGCYGSIMNSIYEGAEQMIGIEEILKKSVKASLQHQSEYKYVFAGLVPFVGIAYAVEGCTYATVVGLIEPTFFTAATVLGADLMGLIDKQLNYKNFVKEVNKMIGKLPCMLDNICGVIFVGDGSCYGDVLDVSYEYISEIYGYIKNLTGNFSTDYHEL